MTTNQSPVSIANLKAEVARFREELNTRDLLVQQLSQELFRLVKDNNANPVRTDASGDYRAEVQLLREQLQDVDRQVQFYQHQLQRRDLEIQQLRQTIRELSTRGQMLEQVIRELPKVYTCKFAERLAPIKDKIVALQTENRQLQANLVAVTDRLTARGVKLDPLAKPAPSAIAPELKLELPINHQPASEQPALAKPAPSTVVFSHA